MAKQSQNITQTQIDVVALLHTHYSPSDLFKNPKTLQLNTTGAVVMKRQFNHWHLSAIKLTGRNLIKLSRKMTYPYYADKKVLLLFTEQDAFMAKLAGSQGWLDAK